MLAIFPEIKKCVEKNDIEQLAFLNRKYFGGEHRYSPKLDVQQLAQSFGIVVIDSDSDYLATVAVKDVGGKPQIFVALDQSLPKIEQKFLLAHCVGYIQIKIQTQMSKRELGKLGYGIKLSPLERYIGKHGRRQGGYAYPHKEERDTLLADQFAASLLLPKGMFLKALNTLEDYIRVGHFFEVSTECVKKRFEQLTNSAESIPAEKNEETLEIDSKIRNNAVKNERTNLEPKEPSGGKMRHATKARRPKTEKKLGMSRIREIANRIDQSVKIKD